MRTAFVQSWSVVLLLLPLALPAQERFTIEHTRRVVGVGSPALSADGRTAAFVVSRPNYVANRTESQLWAVDLPSGAPRPLTQGRTSVSAPKWAPVGRALAFLSPDSEGRNQLWLLAGEGGEARQITAHPTAVEHFSWRPDGAAFAFAASDEEPRKVERHASSPRLKWARRTSSCAARCARSTSGLLPPPVGLRNASRRAVGRCSSVYRRAVVRRRSVGRPMVRRLRSHGPSRHKPARATRRTLPWSMSQRVR